MRLIDEIFQHTRGADRMSLGLISGFAGWIKDENPQCFEIDDGVVEACTQVFKSKPSSILSALDYARMPYPAMWVERVFRPEDCDDDHPNKHKTPPRRVGYLLTNRVVNNSLGKAICSWAWSFADGTIVVCPFSMAFDWHNNLPVKMTLTEDRIQYIREHSNSRWHQYIDNEIERDALINIGCRNGYIGNPIALPFWKSIGLAQPNTGAGYNMHGDYNYALPPDLLDRISEQPRHIQNILYQLGSDLAAEDVLVTGFLLMLNSKNAIVVNPREDLSRLNKSRTKNRRPPLTEFITTRLRIPQHLVRSMNNSVTTRDAARAHMVRGHYKVRKHGVYWWSPHPRGLGDVVKRRQYTVKGA